MTPDALAIPRHKTAIRRRDLSRPVKCALGDGLLGVTTSVFDYGCGHGEDVELLRQQGIDCAGWDPVLYPERPLQGADVVNLGYVVNVIEDPAERTTAVRRAWQLCRQLLVVAAQVRVAGRGPSHVEFGDGILTGRGTFQKYYDQGELKAFLEATLGTEPVPAALGVFYVFKDEALRQQFLASRYRRHAATPRKRVSERRFEEHREILEPFMAHLTQLGRLPEADEFPEAVALISRFGSLRRAFALVRRVTGSEAWDTLRQRRTEDYLVYLALARFRKRPPLGQLPLPLQRDLKAFFGTYSKACRQADELLFRAGHAEAIDEACRRSPVGKLLPNALYVHRSALEFLEPLLRVYEGCGRAYLGEVEGANVIKLHRFSGKISYLCYPDFEKVPHPALRRSVKLSLRTRELECLDYTDSTNPPVLHRKEAFLLPDDPLYRTCCRLTQQEEAHGLLEDVSRIGSRAGWENRLEAKGFCLRGHRLVRRKGDQSNEGSPR
jgi:DNA phosphorothioation-associated putative methyltransferase